MAVDMKSIKCLPCKTEDAETQGRGRASSGITPGEPSGDARGAPAPQGGGGGGWQRRGAGPAGTPPPAPETTQIGIC